MNFSHLLGGLLSSQTPYIFMLLSGLFFSKIGMLDKDGLCALARLSIEIFLPIYYFIQVCRCTYTLNLENNWIIILSFLFYMVIAFLLSGAWALFSKMDVRCRWTFIAIACFTDVKRLHYLYVNTFCYHLDNKTPKETSFCGNILVNSLVHLFFQGILIWYFVLNLVELDKVNKKGIKELWEEVKGQKIELLNKTTEKEENNQKIQKPKDKPKNEEEKTDKQGSDITGKEDSLKDKNVQIIDAPYDEDDYENYNSQEVGENLSKIHNCVRGEKLEIEMNNKTPKEKNEDNISEFSGRNLKSSHSNDGLQDHKTEEVEPIIQNPVVEEENSKYTLQERKEIRKIYKDFAARISPEDQEEVENVYATSDFLVEISKYCKFSFFRNESKIWKEVLLIIFIAPIIGLYTGFVTGFVRVIREWIFDTTTPVYLFFDTFNSIGNCNILMGLFIIGGNIFVNENKGKKFRPIIRNIDYIAHIIIKIIILPFLGIVFSYVINKHYYEDNRALTFTCFIQWLLPTNIDVLFIIQWKDINIKFVGICLCIQYVAQIFINNLINIPPLLKVLKILD